MKICIVGTGTMGHGIAQVFAQAGHEVLLKGRSEASLAKAHKAMDKNLSRMVEKGKLEAGVKDQVLARIKDTMKYEDCADADLVIEAIAEIWLPSMRYSNCWTVFVNRKRYWQPILLRFL